MAENIVAGLFGLTPQVIEQQQLQRGQNLGGLFAAATMNPYATPSVQNAYLAQQGAQFALGDLGARKLGGLFGIQDPELQKATAFESILAETQQELGPEGLQNPELLYGTLATKLANAGLQREATMITMEGQKAIQDYRLSGAKVQTEQAKAQKEMFDMEMKEREFDPLKNAPETVKLRAYQRQASERGDEQLAIDLEADIRKKQFIAEQVPDREADRLILDEFKAQFGDTQGAFAFRDWKNQEEARLRSAGAGRTTIVNNLGDKGAELILEKVDIPIVNKFSESAETARNLARDSKIIADALRGQQGGAIIKLTTKLQKDLGLEGERVTAQDLANSLATRGAVQIRAPGSGSTSDLEFKAYIEAFPSLANSEAGRELMAKYAERLADRSEKLADYGRKLIKENAFSQSAISEYDRSLGPVLGDDFYDFKEKPASASVGVGLKTPAGKAAYDKYKGKK